MHGGSSRGRWRLGPVLHLLWPRLDQCTKCKSMVPLHSVSTSAQKYRGDLILLSASASAPGTHSRWNQVVHFSHATIPPPEILSWRPHGQLYPLEGSSIWFSLLVAAGGSSASSSSASSPSSSSSSNTGQQAIKKNRGVPHRSMANLRRSATVRPRPHLRHLHHLHLPLLPQISTSKIILEYLVEVWLTFADLRLFVFVFIFLVFLVFPPLVCYVKLASKNYREEPRCEIANLGPPVDLELPTLAIIPFGEGCSME